jgi:hypothetical protein
MVDVYVDSDVSTHHAGILIAHGHSARTARDEDRESARDPEQLLLAAQRGWVLITHNKKDFRLLHDAWQDWSVAWRVARNHSGIFILEQVPVTVFAPAVLALLDSGAQFTNRLYEWSRAHGWRMSDKR